MKYSPSQNVSMGINVNNDGVRNFSDFYYDIYLMKLQNAEYTYIVDRGFKKQTS